MLRRKLSKLTTSPVFVEKYQRRFIVKVGPFANRQMSDNLKRSLKQHGVTGVYSLLM